MRSRLNKVGSAAKRRPVRTGLLAFVVLGGGALLLLRGRSNGSAPENTPTSSPATTRTDRQAGMHEARRTCRRRASCAFFHFSVVF